jgi:hypothetical protein
MSAKLFYTRSYTVSVHYCCTSERALHVHSGAAASAVPRPLRHAGARERTPVARLFCARGAGGALGAEAARHGAVRDRAVVELIPALGARDREGIRLAHARRGARSAVRAAGREAAGHVVVQVRLAVPACLAAGEERGMLLREPHSPHGRLQRRNIAPDALRCHAPPHGHVRRVAARARVRRAEGDRLAARQLLTALPRRDSGKCAASAASV